MTAPQHPELEPIARTVVELKPVPSPESGSANGGLAQNDWRLIGLNILYASAAAACTAALAQVPNLHFGTATPMITGCLVVIFTAAHRFFADTRPRHLAS